MAYIIVFSCFLIFPFFETIELLPYKLHILINLEIYIHIVLACLNQLEFAIFFSSLIRSILIWTSVRFPIIFSNYLIK